MLDFKKQGFIKEDLISHIPLPVNFSSIQIQSGFIYVIGGINNDPCRLISTCLEIDHNMNLNEKTDMIAV